LNDNDAEIEKVWNSQHSLQEFLDPSNFKSYDELKRKLDAVLSGASAAVQRAESMDLEEADRPRAKTAAPTPKAPAIEEDDDESLSYFAKLASDD